MFSLSLIVAAGSLTTLVSGTPIPSFPSTLATQEASGHSLLKRATAYSTTYGGNGEVSAGWPSQDDWVSDLDSMVESNMDLLKSSCAQWKVPNNSDEEINNMKSSIQSVASSTGVDPRFIFAIVMQESNGCVRAPTTDNGVVNPGLMQSHNGVGSCNAGSVLSPCPLDQITQMIQDGTAGTPDGDGLKQCISSSGSSDVSKYYKAARLYNSGSIDSSKNLGAGIATHCYATDIANRLTGWSSGPSSCDPDTVGSLTGSLAGIINAPANLPVAFSSSAAPTPSAAGGAFVELPSPTQATAAAVPEPQAPQSSAAAPAPVVASTSAPVPVPTPEASPSESPAEAPPAPITPSPGAMTPGSACSDEGAWNCIDGDSFQRCGSGSWSVINQVASGTKCNTGQSSAIDILAIVTKRVPTSQDQHLHAHAQRHI